MVNMVKRKKPDADSSPALPVEQFNATQQIGEFERQEGRPQ
jgi:hypothetical protein